MNEAVARVVYYVLGDLKADLVAVSSKLKEEKQQNMLRNSGDNAMFGRASYPQWGRSSTA